jgi:hypothetical protein
MKFTVISNPILLDFIRVTLAMTQEQRECFTAISGHQYDVDGIAIGNYMQPGPKWVFHVNSQPIAFGGFVPQRPGVFRDFFVSTADAFAPECYFSVTREVRRLIYGMLRGGAHRIECVTPAARVTPKLHKWYSTIGYNKEALHHGYCANGADALVYARVRH